MLGNELDINCGPRLSKPRPNGAVRSLPAFSLIELMISIALLGLMMTLAGKVFSISVKSTGQAAAVMDVSQSLRLLEESLRADLGGIDPERSLMVIDAHPISAYWTSDDQAGDADDDPTNGYPHVRDPEREIVGSGINGNPGPPWRMERPRADVLMFFTSRDATSAIYPQVRSNTVQVVYGHAELGELQSDGTWAVNPLVYPTDPTMPFWNAATPFRDRYFARNWHLARRSVLMVDTAEVDLETLLPINVDPPAGMSPDDEGLVLALNDIIAQSNTAFPDGGFFFFQSEVVNRITQPAPPPPAPMPNSWWYARSRMDPTPPAMLRNRLGHYFLPNCASFKVEWALTDPTLSDVTEIVWVDPADVVASVDAQLANLTTLGPSDFPRDQFQPSSGRRFDPDRLVGPGMVPVGTTHVFFARDPLAPPGSTDADPFFPRALRITVDVYDDAGRFSRPMRHVMVIPVGNDG